MTAPSYTTDLNDIATADESSGWAESSSWNDGSVATQETDYYIQGSYCVSSELKLTKSGYASLIYNYGSNLYSSFGTDYVVLAWMKFLGPNVLDTDANGGIFVIIGSGLTAFNAFDMGGSEFYRYGGWINIAADPTLTPSGTDQTVGSPSSTTYQYFGVGIKIINPISKGNPFGVDCIRYGRGISIFEYGDGTNGYCTFAGFAEINDANDATNGYNRWGLLQAVAGGYLFKGLMSLGTASNACDFRDSNKQVIVDNTKKVSSTFNAIKVYNASSRVDWIGITILSLGTVSPGSFEAVDDADINFDGCTFTDLDTFIFQSNSEVIDTTFRRCGQITQGGGTFNGCLFANITDAVSLLVDDPDVVSNCTFISDGSNHAIELTSDCAGNSYTLTNLVVSGYATSDGSTGNEVIHNVSGGTVTLNISGGSGVSNISVYDESGTTVLVANYTFTITGLEYNTEVTIVTSGTSTVLFNVENATTSDGAGKYQVTYSHSGGATVDVLIHHIDYKPDISNIYALTLPSSNSSAKVKMFLDENYENP